jgi:hypothetical protein
MWDSATEAAVRVSKDFEWRKGIIYAYFRDECQYTAQLEHTLATTDINSAQAEGSPIDMCCLFDLMSSSLIETSPITLLAANWANCFAAVFLTEVDDPVSNKSRSLSNLEAE